MVWKERLKNSEYFRVFHHCKSSWKQSKIEFSVWIEIYEHEPPKVLRRSIKGLTYPGRTICITKQPFIYSESNVEYDLAWPLVLLFFSFMLFSWPLRKAVIYVKHDDKFWMHIVLIHTCFECDNFQCFVGFFKLILRWKNYRKPSIISTPKNRWSFEYALFRK